MSGPILRGDLTGALRALHPTWKGGKSMTRDGYLRVRADGHPWPRKGYLLEHVRVMELHLGRRLRRDECIKHKDGNKLNNTVENLEMTCRYVRRG